MNTNLKLGINFRVHKYTFRSDYPGLMAQPVTSVELMFYIKTTSRRKGADKDNYPIIRKSYTVDGHDHNRYRIRAMKRTLLNWLEIELKEMFVQIGDLRIAIDRGKTNYYTRYKTTP